MQSRVEVENSASSRCKCLAKAVVVERVLVVNLQVSNFCLPGSSGPTYSHRGTKEACWWSFPSDPGKKGYHVSQFGCLLTRQWVHFLSFQATQRPSKPNICLCLQCLPLSKVNENISSEIPRAESGYIVTSLRASNSYTGPLVVHGVFAVLQAQSSFFEVHHSLLWCVNQGAGDGNT